MRRAVFFALASAMGPASAWAQLAPTHQCAHVRQAIEATLSAPAKPGAGTDVEAPTLGIELISPATGEVLESRPAKPGVVDLAAMFPRLWTTQTPQVLFAQAAIGKERIGPPVVLVPMLPPRYAPRIDRDGTPRVPPVPGVGKALLSGYWTYIEQRVEITTAKGKLVFALHPEAAPYSVANFRELVSKGFYDATSVHRIASLTGRTLPDIIQFGDPTGTGLGGPGYFIDYEPSPLGHGFGTLSYARTSDPNSASSQVFVCLGKESGRSGGEGTRETSSKGAPGGIAGQLDGKYTVFATLISGADTLAAIAKTPVDADSHPREPVKIESAKLVDAPPFGTGPKPEGNPFERPTGR